MTTTSTSLYTPFADGRTVHDIVEHSPALVDEAWCRNLLRQVLQSLEQQYASGAPHRRITPDTLVMLNNGDALLLPAAEDDAPADASLAADLHALALVVHYAITAELTPEGPIGPRLYDNYSDQLTKGIDRCLGPNLRLRPKTIDEMRALLGLETSTEPAAVSGGAIDATPAAAVPATAPTTAPPADAAARTHRDEAASVPSSSASDQPAAARMTQPAAMAGAAMPGAAAASVHADALPGRASADAASAAATPSFMKSARPPAPAAADGNGRLQRWAMMAGAAVALLAAGSALVALLQENARPDTPDTAALAQPGAGHDTNALGRGDAVLAPVVTQGTTTAVPADAPAAPAAPAVPAMSGATPAAALPGAAPAPAARADAVVNGTTYKLLIKPWGTVYVNGVDRGVSPPVKRLTLGPGSHTIRIVNPNFPEHVRTITAGTEEGATIEHDFAGPAE